MQRQSNQKGRIFFIPMLGSSSSSSFATAAVMSPPPPKYDVFLSFRGEDTRENFTSHLYAELGRKNINTFIDYKLERGDEISSELYKAIEQSTIYVIIFSQQYASSSWCLDELAKILECRKRYGRDVIPVFYKVDPSSVRQQKESYADAFVNHENRFKDEVTRRWKVSLTEAAGISGWNSRTTRPESMLVKNIVEDILRKLDRSFSSDNQGVVGIDKHIAQVQSLLHLESAGVRIIGIWGMGGIGKSTLARALHNKLAIQFSSRSCIINAQQEIERIGVDSLRKKYLSELLEEEISSNGLHFAIERVKRAKVLLILDDVKDSSQVQKLFGGRGNFGQGSRIIVTSRDIQVLWNAEADGIYKVKEMDSQDSLKLFSLKAFKQNYPIEGYTALVEKVLEYAKGVPLALEVLGSLLYGKAKKAWESGLQKLEKFPDDKIFNVLKLSYDGLDNEQKEIFLDIACFYRGHLEHIVEHTLDNCGFSAQIGMDVLKDRGFISIWRDRIVVHGLMVEMGLEIVRRQCVNDPGKRSHLWDHEEIYHVLRNNKGTHAIQCIFLEIYKIKEVQLHPETFKHMPNMRILHFHKYSSFFEGQSNVILPASFGSLPDGLKVLHWDEFPLRSLPLDFCPENLVEIVLFKSSLEQLWEDDQELPNLKRLNLSFSSDLIRIPDLSKFPNIEEITLSGCESLTQVYSSRLLNRLNFVWLIGCFQLTSLNLRSNILSRSSGVVWLCDCWKLETFSINRTEVVKSRGPHFDGMAIEICDDAKGPSGYQEMNGKGLDEKYLKNLSFREIQPSRVSYELCWLNLGNCRSLTSLPNDLYKLKLLRGLILSGCSNLEKFPEIEKTMENLAVLVLDGTAIQELPSSLQRLVGLEELSLNKCRRLKIIPSWIGRLTKLCKLDLTDCESLETCPSSIFKLKLTGLDFKGCSKLKTFPQIFEPAESFAHISLTETAIKKLPSSLDFLVGIQTLCLNECRNLESLPSSIGNLNLLTELDFSFCCKLTEIPNDIGRLISLSKLSLQDTAIVNLPESIAHLSRLESLDVSGCRMLECIPQLPPFMKQLLAFNCPSIRRLMMPNPRKEGTFKLYFTNYEEEKYPSACSDVLADARLRIIEDAYRFVFYCFPGSAVPDWFPYRGEGNSVTVNKSSLDQCNYNRLIGFAVCVVLRHEDMPLLKLRCRGFRYRLTLESDGFKYIIPNDVQLNDSLSLSCYRMGHVKHTFLWKHYLMDFASIDKVTFHALNFTFDFFPKWLGLKVYPEMCGICPLYNKEKDDNGDGAC
ncbi:disease resistance protein RPV1-like [Lotus japonicus]|uniref:disease resistance protein RPV1-like n=1 Tax=Lotus japonicus TaxID=34305 RepID=UPI00258CDDF7|nr:disease resistance protein RPV1-like [Lotus japonicus]XP_057437659.1 disease resistance protein RPV1-like [Lotus japonicus]XP_057437660.1 disease resistance protein RPV1-like [Lotus japonicus]XP_057437661.1 disease resistance protein RPV1-like [Lotus japonicus]